MLEAILEMWAGPDRFLAGFEPAVVVQESRPGADRSGVVQLCQPGLERLHIGSLASHGIARPRQCSQCHDLQFDLSSWAPEANAWVAGIDAGQTQRKGANDEQAEEECAGRDGRHPCNDA